MDRWERYFKVIENKTGDKNLKNKFNFRGKRIFELGCGPLFGWGPIAIFLGADTYYYHEPALEREVTLSQVLKEKYFSPLYKDLNSTLKCNSMTSCEKSGAAVGSVLFPPSKMRSTNETLQSAHAGTKIWNKDTEFIHCL